MEKLPHYETCFTEVYDRQFSATDPRIGDFVSGSHGLSRAAKALVSSANAAQTLGPRWAAVGHPDDDGIAIGNGRRGAAGGPNAIRKHLYKMTPHLLMSTDRLGSLNPVLASASRAHADALGFQVADFGNLDLKKFDLAGRHREAIAQQTLLYADGFKILALGGGHDYGYADGAAFLNSCGVSPAAASKNSSNGGGLKPLVVNIDAHLDVRPSENGLSSGTPFYRLLSEYGPQNFELLEIGVQSQCNSKEHLSWAIERGVGVLSYDDILMSGLPQGNVMIQFLIDKLISKKRPVFLSVDMDAFEAPFGAGCSAPATVGLKPDEFLKFLATLTARTNVCGIGLYEAAPSLDRDDMTSRFAARIAFEALYRA